MKSVYIKRLIAPIFLSVVCCFTSCNEDSFFLLPDRSGIDAAIWDSEGSVQLHLNRTYDLVVPQFLFEQVPDRFGIHYASDENFFPHQDQWARRALGMDYGYTLGNHDVRYTGNLYNIGRTNNRYFDIAYCNNGIYHIPLGNMPEETKRIFLGQYHALRAMVYFELAKVYGGVPLILEPVDPENITVSGRNSAREIFDAVLNDLNTSMEYLDGIQWDDATGRGKINKVIAACLKAKVLLYWASPQFNPENHPSYDVNRWQQAHEASREAYELCLAAGHALVPDYSQIFRVEGSQNPEAILVRTYSNSIQNRGHNGENRARPASAGGSAHRGFVATTRLLDAYPMRDGNPIGEGAYDYDNTLFWKNRDPRFEATIAYNGSQWPLNGDQQRRQWTYVGALSESNLQGVYCKRFTTPNLGQGAVNYTSGIGGNGMDWIEIRLAEVMLNLAETANETGDIGLSKQMLRAIRQRAGIEEGEGSNDYGLSRATDKESLRDFILNERMIEFAFENKRNSDLRRTRKMHLLTGSMQTVLIDVVNGDATREILHAEDSSTGRLFRDGLDINDRATYSTYFRTWIADFGSQNYGPYSIPEFHYFYTFHNDFVNKGVNIEPTVGWAGGTFDPLAD